MGMNASQTIQNMENETMRLNYINQRRNMGNGKLDRQGFIQLILAQIKNQDPTNPTDQTQMLNQQVQLEMADQMNSMVASNNFSHASTLIGKQVDVQAARWDFENGMSLPPQWDISSNAPKIIRDVVESVQFDYKHNKALLKIDGEYYELSQVKQVSNAPVSP